MIVEITLQHLIFLRTFLGILKILYPSKVIPWKKMRSRSRPLLFLNPDPVQSSPVKKNGKSVSRPVQAREVRDFPNLVQTNPVES